MVHRRYRVLLLLLERAFPAWSLAHLLQPCAHGALFLQSVLRMLASITAPRGLRCAGGKRVLVLGSPRATRLSRVVLPRTRALEPARSICSCLWCCRLLGAASLVPRHAKTHHQKIRPHASALFAAAVYCVFEWIAHFLACSYLHWLSRHTCSFTDHRAPKPSPA